MSQLKVNSVVDASGGNTATINSMTPTAGSLQGFRNRLINGNMVIAQRGTSFASPASGAYTLDRWSNGNATDAAFTISQQTDVPSGSNLYYSLRLAVTTADTSIAAGQVAGVRQWIEGFNINDLVGQTFTLSFWVRSTKTGTHCIAFKNADVSDRSYVAEYTVNASNTWEYKTITVSGGLPSTGTWNYTNGQGLVAFWTLAVGSTFQTTAGAWQSGNFFGTSSQVNCLDSNTNIFAITGCQLEVGGTATPVERRPYGTELMLCQRYYEQITGSTTEQRTFGIALASSTTNARMIFYFKQQKRATPTIVGTSVRVSVGADGTSPTVYLPGLDVSGVDYTTSGLTANSAYLIFNRGGSADSIAFSSEL